MSLRSLSQEMSGFMSQKQPNGCSGGESLVSVGLWEKSNGLDYVFLSKFNAETTLACSFAGKLIMCL